jgi:hypothetical protein
MPKRVKTILILGTLFTLGLSAYGPNALNASPTSAQCDEKVCDPPSEPTYAKCDETVCDPPSEPTYAKCDETVCDPPSEPTYAKCDSEHCAPKLQIA